MAESNKHTESQAAMMSEPGYHAAYIEICINALKSQFCPGSHKPFFSKSRAHSSTLWTDWTCLTEFNRIVSKFSHNPLRGCLTAWWLDVLWDWNATFPVVSPVTPFYFSFQIHLYSHFSDGIGFYFWALTSPPLCPRHSPSSTLRCL